MSNPASAIYVTNETNNSITVYAGSPSGTLNEAPFATIAGNKTGLNSPSQIALDASGKIYVANFGSGTVPGSITVYAANPCGTLNEAPLATITGSSTKLVNVIGVAVAASGKIYATSGGAGVVGGSTGTIEDFAANPSGTLNEAPLSSTTLPSPEGLAIDASGNIYVAIEQSTNNSIVVFAGSPSGTLSPDPFAAITGSNTGLLGPTAVAVDASGKIYVVSPFMQGNMPERLLVYAPITNGGGNEAPLASITGSNTALVGASSVAIDATGKIYVANYADSELTGGNITVYAANPAGTLNEAPLAMIVGSKTGLDLSEGVAVRPSSAMASAPPTSPPTPSPTPTPASSSGPSPTPTPTRSSIPTPTPTPTPPASGPALYVANSGNNSISVTAITSGGGNEAPRATIAGSNTGLADPTGVAVDSHGKIYVANEDANASGPGYSVTVYAANPSGTLMNPSPTLNEAPLATITGSKTGLAEPYAIAVDASGKIYVANAVGGGSFIGSITVYAANPSGTLNEAPLATVTGTATGLNIPEGLALDKSGKIYVANETQSDGFSIPSVTVYPANPTGTLDDEAPLATINGKFGTTSLVAPEGVAVDASGKIYVADGCNCVFVYAANPSGTTNEAPLAAITGSSTGLTQPGGIALSGSGKIYVTNTAYPSVTTYAANPSGTLNEAPLAAILGSDARLSSPVGVAVH
jgi:mucin-19